MNQKSDRTVVVGAGPIGCVLSVLLARRGHRVTLYEKRKDLRTQHADAGRSINLVLTNRGLRALDLVGMREKVLALTVPVLGRMMHAVDGTLTYQPYGKDDTECNYSVPREELNAFLLNTAQEHGVELAFEHKLLDVDLEAMRLTFESGGSHVEVDADVIFGADGAPSRVRRSLTQREDFSESSELIDYGYKELTFPAGPDNNYAMAGHALHIWPRGNHMLMGLANLDGSFTGTIYLPWKGPLGFESLETPEAVRAFFQTHYPDAIKLLPQLEEEFANNPTGILGTVRCHPWHLEDRVLLIGDAAHAIVPFFGQGLNCGLEDCAVLNGLLDEIEDRATLFSTFDRLRKPNADAIADMALDNFIEMRDRVGDPRFILKKQVERRIEQAMPHLYRSRYATVMYSDNPYRVALEAGKIQQDIFETLLLGVNSAEEVDMTRAEALIRRDLSPFYERHQVNLDF